MLVSEAGAGGIWAPGASQDQFCPSLGLWPRESYFPPLVSVSSTVKWVCPLSAISVPSRTSGTRGPFLASWGAPLGRHVSQPLPAELEVTPDFCLEGGVKVGVSQ